jgi:hypothetical protein
LRFCPLDDMLLRSIFVKHSCRWNPNTNYANFWLDFIIISCKSLFPVCKNVNVRSEAAPEGSALDRWN